MLTHLWLLYWIMKKCKYYVVFRVLTWLPIFVLIIKLKLQLTQCWCRMMLFFTISNKNLQSSSQQSNIKSFINSLSISQNNCKPFWIHRTTCTSWKKRKNFKGVTVKRWRKTKTHKWSCKEWLSTHCEKNVQFQSFLKNRSNGRALKKSWWELWKNKTTTWKHFEK